MNYYLLGSVYILDVISLLWMCVVQRHSGSLLIFALIVDSCFSLFQFSDWLRLTKTNGLGLHPAVNLSNRSFPAEVK